MFADLRIRHWLLLVVGCALGLGIGLAITWVVWPVQYIDTDPVDLRGEHKDDYVMMIAAAHSQHGDLGLAELRLDQLGFDDAKRVVVGLFQRYGEAGYGEEARSLARLAYDLGVKDVALLPYLATPTPTREIIPSPTVTPTVEATITPTPTQPPPEPTATPTEPPPEPTALATQPPLTETPTPAAGVDFQLVEQTDLGCSTDWDGDYILVYVKGEHDRGLAGVQIVVAGPEGEDTFFTGLKPEVDPGFADFRVTAPGTYTVQVLNGMSQIAEELAFGDACPAESPHHSWRVIFRRVSG